jgi:hypothetical protein
MLSRRQMLAGSLALLSTSSLSANLNPESNVSEDTLPWLSDDLVSYDILRNMLTYQMIGHSPAPGPGHIYAGQAWYCRKGRALKFIDGYYAKHHLLPRGIHTVPSSYHPRVINFDVLTQTLKTDLEYANLSNYPEWTGVVKIRGLSA